jgi:hypothetical protein
MRSSNTWIIVILLPLFLWNCSKDDDSPSTTPSASTNKIMPLGSSRVHGDRPDYESYRYELWKMLNDSNYTFDFIGAITDEFDYPSDGNAAFDRNHEGRTDYRSDQILSGISTWIQQAGSPDMVLLSSPGLSDVLQGKPYDNIPNNLNQIIDIIQEDNPNVTIILEQPAPVRSGAITPGLSDYYNQIQQDLEDIAATQSTNTSAVLTIDMFAGFNDNLLADDTHYNEDGAKFIADRYFPVVVSVLQ